MPFNDYEVRGETTAFFIVRRNGDVHEVLIDTEDLPRLIDLGRKWKKASANYAVTNTKMALTDKWIEIRLHRFIMNCPSHLLVDHINHNGFDNRKSNLRICTKGENNQNLQGARKHNKTSNIRGVSWKKSSGKWRAYATINRKQNHLGFFDHLHEAEAAVIAFRKEHMPYSAMDQKENVI
ncbi:AP2 domain-containing protein [Seinonella peptonophila]|uniref:AP2 domain-containing protein n=1 Tax=Seinonella peptonophila TaxID=112248 RepID=A0A1M4VA84_9BACL|nr:AP2 domain-containing protein [Seinonella peptonophila]SHE65852.1 AP2 domain-containing protein [Seinonella peptonophila]